MISIRKATSELDRLNAALRAVVEVYENAILCTWQYAVDLNPADVIVFREHLEAIRQRIPRGASEEDWRSTQASFRGELREYRDKAVERIAGFQAEIHNAAEAMHSFAESVAASGSDHEKTIQASLSELDQTTRCESISEIHEIIGSVRESLVSSVEQMSQRHKMVIAELRDELKLLHKHIETQQRTAALDACTGVWNRAKLDSHVASLLEDSEPFCLLLISIRNMKRTEVRFSPKVREAAIQALLQRLSRALGQQAPVGRWNTASFAAVPQVEPASAIHFSQDISRRLSGMYSIQDEGLAYEVPLEVTTGVIDRARGSDGSSFHKKLLQLSEKLAGA